MLNECKWCGGLGVERAHPNDSGYTCPDCMGTGFQGGKEAERKFDEMVSHAKGGNLNGKNLYTSIAMRQLRNTSRHT